MTKSTITREQITSWMNDANYALEEPLNADDAAAARAILAMGDELLAAMDSEPVAWTEKCEITNMQATGLYLRGFPDNSHGRDIPLYRHAQPAPVVQDEREAFEAFMAKRFGGTVNQHRANNGDRGYVAWDMVVAWIVWQARAAMLAAAPQEVKGDD
ncbi:TPA: hypothetical protein QIF84_003784 [Klebsiella aerogenes]|nr:hypothetical protein [Klebsiella aerogenes]